jgi:ABC-type lipoprotein export system ATPase subunit
MKIRRIILEGVNNFERFDYTFEYDWTDEVPDSLLLLGPNGSGKTTLLNVIAGLWELFEQWIESPPDSKFIPNLTTSIPSTCQWATMELVGLKDDRSLWVFYAERLDQREPSITNWSDVWADVQREDYRVGVGWAHDQGFYRLYFPPGALYPATSDAEDGPWWNWIDEWRQSHAENVLGKRHDLPNIVFIESEDRKVPRIAESFEVIREQIQEFLWLARYKPTERRKGSLENYLYNLSAVDKPTLDQILDKVNAFLIDKRIVGFDKWTSALMVEVNGGERHTIDLLSSGEKQVLMLITFITRWLRPGGIVLIDEPDLHLHISWINALVSLLRRMVAEQDGQLIIASHESSLWERFTQSHQVPLGVQTEIQR